MPELTTLTADAGDLLAEIKAQRNRALDDLALCWAVIAKLRAQLAEAQKAPAA